jgi:peptidoglycan/LPS O-acetylase OafA/YrhL
MTTKFENIQALRGVAVLLVVIFHLLSIEQKYWHNDYVFPKFLILGNAGVDLFFVISGFVMIVVTKKQFQDFNAAQHFLYHRISRIFPLYWLFTGFLLIIHLISPGSVTSLPEHQDYVWKSFLLLPQNQPPLLMNGWTLIHEMYFYLVLTLFLLVPEKYLVKLLGCWGIFILIGTLFLYFYPKFNSPSFALVTHPLTLEFIAGCFVAKLFFAGKRFHPILFLLLGIFLLLLNFTIFYLLSSNPDVTVSDGRLRVLMFGIACGLLVYAAAVLEYKAKLFPKFLINVGNSSYSIYLSHIFVLSTLGRIFAKLPWQGAIFHLFFALMALPLVIIVGKYSYVFLEKPLLKVSRKWWTAIAVPETTKSPNA